VTLKGQARDLNTFRAIYLENGWRWYLETIPDYYVSYEAVRSAILATAWLLVVSVTAAKNQSILTNRQVTKKQKCRKTTKYHFGFLF